MKQDELRYVMATKASLYKRLLIEIPKKDIGFALPKFPLDFCLED